MDDLINRQHAIYTIDKYISGFDAIDANFLDGLKTAKKLIKELSSAQPTQNNTSNALKSLDYIDRQAAVNSVAKGLKGVFVEYQDFAEKLLDNVPSVHPDFDAYCDRLWKLAYERGKRDAQPQRWIPVSERLPRDDEEVIVSCLDDSGDTQYSYTTVAWHYKGMWVCDNERCPFVVAWKPLPKPYKEGQK